MSKIIWFAALTDAYSPSIILSCLPANNNALLSTSVRNVATDDSSVETAEFIAPTNNCKSSTVSASAISPLPNFSAIDDTRESKLLIAASTTVLSATSSGSSAINSSIFLISVSIDETISWTAAKSSPSTIVSTRATNASISWRRPESPIAPINFSKSTIRSSKLSNLSVVTKPIFPSSDGLFVDDEPAATTRCGKYLPIDKRGDVAARVAVTVPPAAPVVVVAPLAALFVVLDDVGRTRNAPARVDADVADFDADALDALLYVPAPPSTRTGAAEIAGVATSVHNAQIIANFDVFVSVFMSSLY